MHENRSPLEAPPLAIQQALPQKTLSSSEQPDKMTQVLEPEEPKPVQNQKMKAVEPDIIQSKIREPVVFQEFERRDEEQILLAVLTGAAPSEFVYSIKIKTKQGPRTVRGISYEGVCELRRHYRHIEATIVSIQEVERMGEPGILAHARAVDNAWGNAEEAVKFVPYIGTRANGSRFQNHFSEEVAQSKAKRNAIRPLLPQWLIRRLIELDRLGEKLITAELLGIDGSRGIPETKPQPKRSVSAKPPERLSTKQLEAMRATIDELAPKEKKTARELRRLIKSRLGIMAEGDVDAMRSLLAKITVGPDFDGYTSVDAIKAKGTKPTPLHIAYGKVKRTYGKWIKAQRGKREPADAAFETKVHRDDPEIPDVTAEEAEEQVKAKAEAQNVAVEALQAAALARAKSKKWVPALWPIILGRWDDHFLDALNRMPSDIDREQAEKLGEAGSKKEFYGAWELATKGASDEEDGLAALICYTGLPAKELTPAHWILGAACAGDLR
ncbi:MAG: hypothetical protein ACE5HV_11860 [Acidobacteriota bacterium]